MTIESNQKIKDLQDKIKNLEPKKNRKPPIFRANLWAIILVVFGMALTLLHKNTKRLVFLVTLYDFNGRCSCYFISVVGLDLLHCLF